MEKLTSIEFCAGAGGQALGLEQAGFDHKLLVDNDLHCTKTLRVNRPSWNVRLEDMQESDASDYRGVDLFAAGLPCPPFSVAGKQLGEADERNLFNDALRLIEQTDPKMVLIENVRGFLDPVFAGYREFLEAQFKRLGYEMKVELLNASDYGVSQLRPRVAIVAGKPAYWEEFVFPLHDEDFRKAPPVGELLLDLMAEGARGDVGWLAPQKKHDDEPGASCALQDVQFIVPRGAFPSSEIAPSRSTCDVRRHLPPLSVASMPDQNGRQNPNVHCRGSSQESPGPQGPGIGRLSGIQIVN